MNRTVLISRAALRWGAASAFVLGLGLLGYGLYLPAKAALGQWLLAEAWDEAKTGAAAPKPWWWADISPVARLGFPSLGESRLVLNEASGEAMAWGPGHVTGTQPLGAPGLSAAAAHRDTHFALLAKLGPGDPVTLETADGASARYRVIGAQVVDARVWRFPDLDHGPSILALSTCWPLDAATPGPERLVVFAAPDDGLEPDV